MKFKIKNPNPHRPLSKTSYVSPEYITVEQLPSGKWDSFETWDLKAIPERPTHMICDCCLNKADRLWIRSHYGFCTGFPRAGRDRRDYLAGAWAFCVYCWSLFERGELDVLAARVATLNSEIAADRALLCYQVLAQAVHGEILRWEAGQDLTSLQGTQL